MHFEVCAIYGKCSEGCGVMMALFEKLKTTLRLELDVRDTVEKPRWRLAERLGIEPGEFVDKSTPLTPHQFLSQCFLEDDVCMCSAGSSAAAPR